MIDVWKSRAMFPKRNAADNDPKNLIRPSALSNQRILFKALLTFGLLKDIKTKSVCISKEIRMLHFEMHTDFQLKLVRLA